MLHRRKDMHVHTNRDTNRYTDSGRMSQIKRQLHALFSALFTNENHSLVTNSSHIHTNVQQGTNLEQDLTSLELMLYK